MRKPLTQQDLTGMQCQCGKPGCNKTLIVFRSECHSDTPTWTFYDKTSKKLSVICSECERVVVQFELARGEIATGKLN